MVGDPQTLCACCTVQFSRSEIHDGPRASPPTAQGGGRSGHDGYHIAADMACQGKASERLPAAESGRY
jgi:hypothetical protein